MMAVKLIQPQDKLFALDDKSMSVSALLLSCFEGQHEIKQAAGFKTSEASTSTPFRKTGTSPSAGSSSIRNISVSGEVAFQVFTNEKVNLITDKSLNTALFNLVNQRLPNILADATYPEQNKEQLVQKTVLFLLNRASYQQIEPNQKKLLIKYTARLLRTAYSFLHDANSYNKILDSQYVNDDTIANLIAELYATSQEPTPSISLLAKPAPELQSQKPIQQIAQALSISTLDDKAPITRSRSSSSKTSSSSKSKKKALRVAEIGGAAPPPVDMSLYRSPSTSSYPPNDGSLSSVRRPSRSSSMLQSSAMFADSSKWEKTNQAIAAATKSYAVKLNPKLINSELDSLLDFSTLNEKFISRVDTPQKRALNLENELHKQIAEIQAIVDGTAKISSATLSVEAYALKVDTLKKQKEALNNYFDQKKPDIIRARQHLSNFLNGNVLQADYNNALKERIDTNTRLIDEKQQALNKFQASYINLEELDSTAHTSILTAQGILLDLIEKNEALKSKLTNQDNISQISGSPPLNDNSLEATNPYRLCLNYLNTLPDKERLTDNIDHAIANLNNIKETAKEYFDKIKNARIRLNDIKDKLDKIDDQQFFNITKEIENVLNDMQHKLETRKQEIDKAQAAGSDVSDAVRNYNMLDYMYKAFANTKQAKWPGIKLTQADEEKKYIKSLANANQSIEVAINNLIKANDELESNILSFNQAFIENAVKDVEKQLTTIEDLSAETATRIIPLNKFLDELIQGAAYFDKKANEAAENLEEAVEKSNQAKLREEIKALAIVLEKNINDVTGKKIAKNGTVNYLYGPDFVESTVNDLQRITTFDDRLAKILTDLDTQEESRMTVLKNVNTASGKLSDFLTHEQNQTLVKQAKDLVDADNVIQKRRTQVTDLKVDLTHNTQRDENGDLITAQSLLPNIKQTLTKIQEMQQLVDSAKKLPATNDAGDDLSVSNLQQQKDKLMALINETSWNNMNGELVLAMPIRDHAKQFFEADPNQGSSSNSPILSKAEAIATVAEVAIKNIEEQCSQTNNAIHESEKDAFAARKDKLIKAINQKIDAIKQENSASNYLARRIDCTDKEGKYEIGLKSQNEIDTFINTFYKTRKLIADSDDLSTEQKDELIQKLKTLRQDFTTKYNPKASLLVHMNDRKIFDTGQLDLLVALKKSVDELKQPDANNDPEGKMLHAAHQQLTLAESTLKARNEALEQSANREQGNRNIVFDTVNKTFKSNEESLNQINSLANELIEQAKGSYLHRSKKVLGKIAKSFAFSVPVGFGALAGAAAGGTVGASFFGIGAIPGAIIGGIVGALGFIAGEVILGGGGKLAARISNRHERKIADKMRSEFKAQLDNFVEESAAVLGKEQELPKSEEKEVYHRPASSSPIPISGLPFPGTSPKFQNSQPDSSSSFKSDEKKKNGFSPK